MKAAPGSTTAPASKPTKRVSGKYNVVVDLSACVYEVVKTAVGKKGWGYEIKGDDTTEKDDNCDVYWNDRSVTTQRVMQL